MVTDKDIERHQRDGEEAEERRRQASGGWVWPRSHNELIARLKTAIYERVSDREHENLHACDAPRAARQREAGATVGEGETHTEPQDRCWHNKYHPSRERCANRAVWEACGLGNMMDGSRWCIEHPPHPDFRRPASPGVRPTEE